MSFAVIIEQVDNGEDGYTIGCHHVVVELSAENKEDAVKEAITKIPELVEEYDLGFDGAEVESMSLISYRLDLKPNLDEFLAKRQELVEDEAARGAHEANRRRYEALKRVFEPSI
jgi:hypothetical protein